MFSQSVPSAALLLANKRLLEIRAKHQGKGDAQTCTVQGEEPFVELRALQARYGLTQLPDHLGWGSVPLTEALRARKALEIPQESPVFKLLPAQTIEKRPLPSSGHEETVKLYPDIGMAMLRQGITAPGRLWLLLRHLDQEGRGVLRVVNITHQLTPKTSKLHLCGKRQLRNLIKEGEGIFWTRNKEKLWLRSAAKVAHQLGVVRLTGSPVALPVTALLDGIGSFRAHLYAAFHSGRVKQSGHGQQARPIARETLASISGVGASSQRTYEKQTGIQVRANIALGQGLSKENQEAGAWQKGGALFELRDYCGQQGKQGKTYLAWQLPNSYIGKQQHQPKGRQKRINRELNDLVMKGMPGNVEETSGSQRLEKVYHPNGKLAAMAHKRTPERDVYWQRYQVGNGRSVLWQQWGGQ
jgi:hypothetical protein